MTKVIAILSEDSCIQESVKRLEEKRVRIETRKKFIQKQIDDVTLDLRKAEEETTKVIIDRLQFIAKLPKNLTDKDKLQVDINRDCVLWHHCDEECGA